jgi:exopolysaccharide production protein ExoY
MPYWKRVLDISFILLALPFLLPAFVLIAVWIKNVSSGPLFFRQKRVGFGGRHFIMFKFRTMRENVETAGHESYFHGLIETNLPMTKLDAGDRRIIPGGRILRAVGLDELPQLFNILRGEMSLVGPRPCTLGEWERFGERERERVKAAPGLTGYWQVNGKNSTTFAEMIEMDIFYTKNLSLSLDLNIIFRTVPAILSEVLKRKGIAPMIVQPKIMTLESETQEGEISA